VSETLGTKLRRLEAGARLVNPLIIASLAAVPPWRANANFTAGQVVANYTLGTPLNYLCTVGGQSGTGGPTGTGAGPITDGTVTWFFFGLTNNISLSVSPLVTISSTVPSGLTLSYPIPASAASFFFSGGVPFLQNGREYSFPGVTEPSNSNASTTGSNYGCGVTFYTDAPKFAIAQNNQNTIPWRIIVDGQYISISGTVGSNSANPAYNVVDFGGVRKARKITIESTMGWEFAGVACGPLDSVWAPDAADNIRAIIVGDSLAAGAGNTGDGPAPIIGRTDWPSQIGKYLGWSDPWNSSAGGTGYINNASTKENYIQRVTDVTGNVPDLVIVEGGANDTSSSAANVQAAALAYFQAVRSSLASVPIIVLGIPNAGGPNAATISTENAVAAAVTQFADANTYFIPVATAANPWLTGTGNVNSPAGNGNCDVYTGPDSTHPTQAGIDYFAYRISNAVRNVIQQIA
jgi:lysophospholipase L1-like esterase